MARPAYGWMRGRLMALGALGALVTAGVAPTARAAEPVEHASPPAGTVAAPQQSGPPAPLGAAGMDIYRDPATGQIGTPPPGSVRPRAVQRAADAVERPGTTPAGGVMLERPGGFMHSMSATRDDTGRVKVGCEPGVPGERE